MSSGGDTGRGPREPEGQALGLLGRFLVYGLVGWCIECCFTSVVDLATGAGDLRLMGYSYLWMHPIWGVGLLLGERLTQALHRAQLCRATRALVGMAVCFGVEYATGGLLLKLLGRCPWDYSASCWSVDGLIRLDYAPFWWVCGWVYEPLASFIRRVRVFRAPAHPWGAALRPEAATEGSRAPTARCPC